MRCRALSGNGFGQGSPGWGILKVLVERPELAAHPYSGSPADVFSMPGPGKASAGSSLAKQTSAGTDAAEAAVESALGSAPAEEPDLKEGQVPVVAMAPGSIQEKAESAAQDECSAASAAAVVRAPVAEQQTRKESMPDEALAPPSIQEMAGAAAQNKESAQSAHAAGHASAVEQESAEGLMPDEAMAPLSMQEKAEAAAEPEGAPEPATAAGPATSGVGDTENVQMPDDAHAQSMQENAKAVAQIGAAAESALTATKAPAEEQDAEEALMPDEALAAVSTTQQAEAAAQGAGVTQSALRAGSAPAEEQDSGNLPMPDKAQASVSMQKTTEAASHKEGGARSAGKIETPAAREQASPLQLQPDAALPVLSEQEVAEAATQSATLPLSHTAQVNSHPLELPAPSEAVASVSRKRERPRDLEKLEETEKPGRGSATRLKSPAHVAESAQGRCELLAEITHQTPDASCQTAAAIVGDLATGAAEAMHAGIYVSAAESHEVAQAVSGRAQVSSSDTPASPVVPDVQAFGAPGTAEVRTEPVDALRKMDGAEAVGQPGSTAGVAPKDGSAYPTPCTHVQDSQPLLQAAKSACSTVGSEASTQVPAHAVAARKLASAELLCDEVLPEADFGMPWHDLMDAASEGQGHDQPTPDQQVKATARSRLGQPLPLSLAHDSARLAAASAGTPEAADDAGNPYACNAREPVAEQVALDSKAPTEEALAALDATDIAPGSAQQETQLLPEKAGVLDAAPERDASGQPSIGQPSSASEASPRIAAALLEAGSRITVRAAKPRRATVDAPSSAAALLEAVSDTVNSLPTVEAAVSAEVIEPVKTPKPIKVRNIPLCSYSPSAGIWGHLS